MHQQLVKKPFVRLSHATWCAKLEGLTNIWGFLGGASGKEPTCQCRRHEMWVQSLSWEDLLEEEMTTHSSILGWRIPWTEEPGRLQSIGSLESDRTEAT